MHEDLKTLPMASFSIPKPPADSQLYMEKGNDGAVLLSITTERLNISPVSSAEIDDYHRFLFSNPKVMEKFGTGEVRTRTFVEDRIANWIQRWESGDPFGAYAIRLNSGEFVGHIVLGHGDDPGHSELAYLIRDDYWGRGYGSEAAQAVVQNIAPILRAYGFSVEGETFSYIDATARPDNPASIKILEQLGMKVIGTSEKFGAFREHFRIEVSSPSPDKSWEIFTLGDRTIIKE